MAAKASVAAKRHKKGDPRQGLISDIVAVASNRSFDGVKGKVFVADYYQDVALEDLEASAPDQLAQAALAHLEHAASRKPGRAKVRIYNPTEKRDGWHSEHTVIEVITDDMPFLVDSIAAAIVRTGYGIYLTVHPAFSVTRDAAGKIQKINSQRSGTSSGQRESFSRFEIERISSRPERTQLATTIRESLADVRAAVVDWEKMLTRMRGITDDLEKNTPPIPANLFAESIALLNWMAEDNFTLLGYSEHKLASAKGRTALTRVRGSEMGVLRRSREDATAQILSPTMNKVAQARELLIVTKSNSRSRVHRDILLDYIGIRIFDRSGTVIGIHRFLGLFTSTAYSQSPRRIPLLRQKVHKVLQRSNCDPNSHRGKALMHILDNYPRDELFQARVSELTATSTGILNLQERRKVKLFVRRDVFGRYISCLVFIPRDRFNTLTRLRIERTLQECFGGESTDSEVTISGSTLIRIHIIVHLRPGDKRRCTEQQAERAIADATVTWQDQLRQVLLKQLDEEQANTFFERYRDAFSAGYQETNSADEACRDIELIELILAEASTMEQRLRWSSNDAGQQLQLKVLKPGAPMPLSDVLPVLENFGMTVIGERPYRVTPIGGVEISIQDFDLEHPGGQAIGHDQRERGFTQAFQRAIDGTTESDGLNRLVWLAGLDWRAIVCLRAYSKYILQTGVPFSQPYMEQVLWNHATAVEQMVGLFKARFDPDLSEEQRKKRSKQSEENLTETLEAVKSLDEDRILRAFMAAIKATLRTNFFVRDKDSRPLSYTSIKLDSKQLPELPDPRPEFEIFVYAPNVEGIHLRSGRVARGGIRWSDRREDFRTEVLGLMKAQVVKNALIVPTGAKGGFVVKSLAHVDKERQKDEVRRCYATFIRGLLDITDNIVDDLAVPPRHVVRRDGDDPYLVVAADKGTATFSDLANSIATEYGFWLDDAFASGGSTGYDHKKMGITARGAWEAVKRHFRERGKDIQAQPFTVAGIGDMSGDVFGNGMLLSRHIMLLAAFNHQHIFIDPRPDPEISYQERERLFRNPTLSWADYSEKHISPGGGVYDRQAKKIELSPVAQRILNAPERSITPPELIRLILKMDVDLLWNGGIGTYVKASYESNLDADDRANDPVRVNADELRCNVVGEGGNLGLTQAARVEYARSGGRINTDFIDNSAGVDTSDREVNIKILLNRACRDDLLQMPARNRLLASMTDEVAAQVLRDNYQQTQALSVVESYAPERLPEHAELIKLLERSASLDRELESLPDEETISERDAQELGLTRPELSVIISHAKIHLVGELLGSDAPEDTLLAGEVMHYFPARVQKRFEKLIAFHPLAREIISTLIADSMINRMGPTFVLRAQQETGAEPSEIARAYDIARQVLDIRDFWANIEALDNQVPADVQYSLLFQSSRVMRHAVYWFINNHSGDLEICKHVDRLRPGVQGLLDDLGKVLSGSPKKRYETIWRQYADLGVPDTVAARMAAYMGATIVLDVVSLADRFGKEIDFVTEIYVSIERGLNLDWLRVQIEELEVKGRWQAVARSNLRDGLLSVQRRLATELLQRKSSEPADAVVMDWLTRCGPRIQRAKQMLLEMRAQKIVDFASLTVALQELRRLTDGDPSPDNGESEKSKRASASRKRPIRKKKRGQSSS